MISAIPMIIYLIDITIFLNAKSNLLFCSLPICVTGLHHEMWTLQHYCTEPKPPKPTIIKDITLPRGFSIHPTVSLGEKTQDSGVFRVGADPEFWKFSSPFSTFFTKGKLWGGGHPPIAPPLNTTIYILRIESLFYKIYPIGRTMF